MKKNPKKLKLSRETLRALEDSQLEIAQGGWTENTCHNSCNSTPRSGCETCTCFC